MKYCTYCGKEVPGGQRCDCSGAQEAATKDAKFPKKFMKIIIPVAIVIVAIIVVICIFAGRSSTIDLNNYLVVEGVSGLNGRGTVSYYLDEDALMNDLFGTGDSSEVTENNWEAVAAENYEKLEEIGKALDCITVSASQATGLSNDDIVTVTAVFENTTNTKFRYIFENASQTITVSGLAEGKIVDLFAEENISVTFFGFSGSGEAHIDILASDEVFSLITYKLSSWQNLSNGDTITVTTTFDAAELETLGYLAPEVTEQTIAVTGLSEYFDIADGIPADLLQSITNKAVANTQDLASAEDGEVIAEPEIIGVYYLSVDDPSQPYNDILNGVKIANAIAVATQYTFELNGHEGLSYDRINVWVFPNLYSVTGGEVSYDEDKVTRYFALGADPENMLNWFDIEFWSSLNVSEVVYN